MYFCNNSAGSCNNIEYVMLPFQGPVSSSRGVLSLLTGQTNSFNDNVTFVSSFKSLETGGKREHLNYISHKNINIPPALSFVWDLGGAG